MHNYYTYLYNKCVWEVLEEYKGKNEACLFARSATVGGQKFPVHWGGDCSSNYSSMSESLRGGLSLCLSGFGFWSHDMSGFEGKAPADVYKRWAAFGLLSTHSRLHGSDSYRVPWLFSKEGEENGEESVAVVRKFSELKCTLMPYMFSTAVNTHKTGVPTMRAMVLEFPDDIPCEDLDRQYMLGDSLMVAPVFTKEGDVTYYLPEGKWTHLLSNEKREAVTGCARTTISSLCRSLREKTPSLPSARTTSSRITITARTSPCTFSSFPIRRAQRFATARATICSAFPQ